MNMMKKMNKLGKVLVGSVVCLSATLLSTIESSAYTTIFFDSSIDTRNYQLVVVRNYDNVGDQDYGDEDSYIKETNARGYNGGIWASKFLPDESKSTYEPLNPENITGFGRDPNKTWGSKKVVGKKLTIPAMKMHIRGEEGTVSSMNANDPRIEALTSAIMGYDRESGNLSMVDGTNQILSTIEKLKGGYKSNADFKNTLMALGHLFGQEGSATIKLSVLPPGGEVSDNSTEEKYNKEIKNPDDPNFTGTGEDIEIKITDKGAVRKVSISQSGNPIWDANMVVKVDTGYRLKKGDGKKPGKGDLEIINTNNTKNPTATYVNSNKINAHIYKEDIENIRLDNLIAHALIKESQGITSMNPQGQMNWFEDIIYKILDSALKGFENLLGLIPLEELIYNSSDRERGQGATNGYFYGIFPRQWGSLIITFFSFTAIVSLSIFIFSILRIFYRMTLDSMNVGKRVELKEDIMDVLQSLAWMMVIVIVFRVLAQMNYLFVTTVYDGLGGGSVTLVDPDTMGASGIANIVLRFMLVYIRVYMNIVYVVRSLNVALLLALTPAFVVAVAFGKKQIFMTYLKELYGSIFLQSFHALLFLFIFEAQRLLNTGNGMTSVFITVVLSYTILPTTKMFKDMVMPSTLGAVGEQLGEKYGNKAKNMAVGGAAVAAGMTVGAAGHAAKNAVKNKINQTVSDIKENKKAKEVVDNFLNEGGHDITTKEGREKAVSEMNAEQRAALDKVASSKQLGDGGRILARSASTVLGVGEMISSKGKSKVASQEWSNMKDTWSAVSGKNGIGESELNNLSEMNNMVKGNVDGITNFSKNDKDDYSVDDSLAQRSGFDGFYDAGVSDQDSFLMAGNIRSIMQGSLPSGDELNKMPKDMQTAFGAAGFVKNGRQELAKMDQQLSYMKKSGAKKEEINELVQERENRKAQLTQQLSDDYNGASTNMFDNPSDDKGKGYVKVKLQEGNRIVKQDVSSVGKTRQMRIENKSAGR